MSVVMVSAETGWAESEPGRQRGHHKAVPRRLRAGQQHFHFAVDRVHQLLPPILLLNGTFQPSGWLSKTRITDG